MVTFSQKSDQDLPKGEGKRVAIIAARFHEKICDKLVEGALEALKKCGVDQSDISVLRVPGAFELPLALQSVANTEVYHAAVAIGVVIRGETSHFDYVAGEASAGVREVMLKTGLPTGFGVLTTENVKQAEARAGGTHGNKGYDAAMAALTMAELMGEIEKGK